MVRTFLRTNPTTMPKVFRLIHALVMFTLFAVLSEPGYAITVLTGSVFPVATSYPKSAN